MIDLLATISYPVQQVFNIERLAEESYLYPIRFKNVKSKSPV